jgi:N-formylglutamate deformylase
MRVFELRPGDSPVVLSFPHAGAGIPSGLVPRLTIAGRSSIDTDWNVDRLYSFAAELGIGTIRTHVSRYVVDLNRDPAGVSLYPGARTTAVAPTETFEGVPLYVDGERPTSGEIAARVATFWKPYHDALSGELERVRARHSYAILVDGHSILGRLPLLFDGELPDVNLGTNRGRSCAPLVTEAVANALRARYPSLVVDGRFTGGHITRTYGDPQRDVHAIQIELNQRTYVPDGPRAGWSDAKAATMSGALRAACTALLALVPPRVALEVT